MKLKGKFNDLHGFFKRSGHVIKSICADCGKELEVGGVYEDDAIQNWERIANEDGWIVVDEMPYCPKCAVSEAAIETLRGIEWGKRGICPECYGRKPNHLDNCDIESAILKAESELSV